MLLQECIHWFEPFLFLFCLHFFFFLKDSPQLILSFIFFSSATSVARFKRPHVVPSCLKIKIWPVLSPSTFLHTPFPSLKKNKQTRG